MDTLGFPELLIIITVIIIAGLTILPFWKIFTKAGFSGGMSLTQFIPLVKIIAFFFLAFADWPIRRDERVTGVSPDSSSEPRRMTPRRWRQPWIVILAGLAFFFFFFASPSLF